MKYSFILLGCMSAVPVIGSDFRELLDNPAANFDSTGHNIQVQENPQIFDKEADWSPNQPGRTISEDIPFNLDTSNLQAMKMPFDVEHNEVASPKAKARLAKKISWRCYAAAACAGGSLVAGVIAFIIYETLQ